MAMTKRSLSSLLLAATIAVGGIVSPASDLLAQDWSVEGGDDRRQEIVRRYKVLLERNPTEGLAFKKLLEFAGGPVGLERLIAEYRKKSEAAPENTTYLVILGHLLKANDSFDEALVSYTQALDVEIKGDPPIPALLGRGEVLTLLGKQKEATADFERALEIEKDRDGRQQILRKLADLAFAQRDWERAQDYYGRLIELDPRNEFLRLEYAQVLVKHKRYDIALEQYDALIDIAGRDVKTRATTMRDKGDLLEMMGKQEEALSLYKKAQGYVRSSNWLYRELEQRIIGVHRNRDTLDHYIEQKAKAWGRPSYDQAMILGGLYDEIGQEEKSYEMYLLATKKNRRAIEPRQRVISILQRRGDSKAVIAAYEDLVRVSPSQPRFRIELAKLHFRNGDTKSAERILSQARSRFSRDPEALVQLADIYMRFGMSKDALEVYKRLVRAQPGNDAFIVSLGEYYYQDGETERAVETWKKLLDSSLSSPDAHAQLGLVFVEHNMVERGISHYEKAVALDAENLEIRRGLAMAYEIGRYWERAVETWRDLLDAPSAPDAAVAEARSRIIGIYKRQNRLRTKLREFKDRFDAAPSDRDAGLFLAEAYLNLDDPESAERVWRKMIEADGVVDAEDVEALQRLERVYSERGAHDEAIAVLQKLAELRPAVARDYYQRIADLSLKSFDDDQAVRYAKMALEANPDDANAHAQLGEVWAKMQQTDKAIESYRAALDLDPRAFDVYFALAELLLEKGETERAEALYRKVASGATDESMIGRAARGALGLARDDVSIELLEREIAPLVFSSPPRPIYREIMLEIYSRLAAPLISASAFGAAVEKEKERALTSFSDRAFPLLLDAAQSQDIGQRQRAITMLAELRAAPASLSLANMVNDSSDPLRLEALGALARIGDSRAATPLVRALDDESVEVRDAAAWALGAVGDAQAARRLRQIVEQGQSSRQRGLAALSLGRLRDKESAPLLLARLQKLSAQNYTDSVATPLVVALGLIGHAPSVEELAKVMRTSTGRAGDAAAWALGQIETDDALRALLEAYWSEDERSRIRGRRGLLGRAESDSDRPIVGRLDTEVKFLDSRRQTFDVPALQDQLDASLRFVPNSDVSTLVNTSSSIVAEVAAARLGSEASALVLSDLLQGPSLGLGGENIDDTKTEAAYLSLLRKVAPALRRSAMDEGAPGADEALVLLGRLGERGDTGEIIGAARSTSASRRERAASALAYHLADTKALSAVVSLLSDESPHVRVAAARALSHAPESISSPPIDALIARLDDPYPSVQAVAATALGALGGARATSSIATRLESASPIVRASMLRALAQIGTPEAKNAIKPWRERPDWRIPQGTW